MCHVFTRGGLAALAGALLLPFLASAFPAPPNKPGEPSHSAPAKEALAQAARAWSTKDAAAALESCLPLSRQVEVDSTQARCRLIAAAALLERGEPERAEAVLEPALAKLGVLEPWARLLLADARLRAGKVEEVLPLLESAKGADPNGPLGQEAAALEALLWLHDPERPGAEAAMLRLLAAGQGDEARLRLALARHLLHVEKKEKASEHLLAVWSRFPEREEASQALALLDSLGVEAGWAELRTRVEGLLRVGQAERALSELGDRSAPAEALFLRGRALMDAGQREEAEAVLGRYLEAKPKKRTEVLTLLGRLAARREDLAQAVAHLDEAAKAGAGREAAEAAFLAAFLHYDFGRFGEAAERFEAYAKLYGHRLDEARWFRGFSHYLQGECEKAERAFAVEPKGPLGLQMLYWRARTLERLGRAEEAKTLFRRVLALGPTEWYGLLAGQRLGEGQKASLEAKPAGAGSRGKGGIRKARLDRAEALYQIGFRSEAGREFDAATAGRTELSFLRAAARLALREGDPHRAYRLSWRLGGIRSASDLAYPRAFPDALRRASELTGVDPEFLLSIARQESGFSTTVRSPRGAVGLMQILPATARRIVSDLGVEAAPDRLDDPHENLLLGASYLAALLKRFERNPALAAAAYNAGPPAVVRWLEDPLRKELALDEWVEAIPWRETRNYVKVVLGNWATYRALDGKPPPALSPSLPKPREGVDF